MGICTDRQFSEINEDAILRIVNFLKEILKTKFPWLFSKIRWAYHFINGGTSLRRAEKNLSKIRDTQGQFNLKIQYKMAHDRNPMLTIYADKSAVRKFVEDRTGTKYLTQLFYDSHDPTEVLPENLPEEFVVKANHGSGAVIVVSTSAPLENQITMIAGTDWRRHLIHPDRIDWEITKELMKKWMKQNYYWFAGCGRHPEWAYKNIAPRIIVEELLKGEDNDIPDDFRFYMFDGNCEIIRIANHRFSGSKYSDVFDSAWNLLPFNIEGLLNSSRIPTKPEDLEEMLEVAKALSKGLDFIRIDLYRTNQGIKFGEMTNYPEGGTLRLSPEIYNVLTGKLWIPKYA